MELLDKLFRHKRHDVALALSSGGARGLAHIGAIDTLMAHGYHITSLAGTSFGAIVAGMYATGHLDDFKAWMATIDKKRMRELTDFSPSLTSLVKGERIIDELKKLAPDCQLEDLSLPVAIIATDWNTGREVVFRHGSLWYAIRASISVPGYFAPVKHEGHALIDGGLTNPLPLDRVSRNGKDLLVGINVSGHDYGGIFYRRKLAKEWQSKRSKAWALLDRLLPEGTDLGFNYFTLLNQAVSISISHNAQRAIELCRPDIMIDIPMKRYSGSDYDKYAHIYKVGATKMERALQKFEH